MGRFTEVLNDFRGCRGNRTSDSVASAAMDVLNHDRLCGYARRSLPRTYGMPEPEDVVNEAMHLVLTSLGSNMKVTNSASLRSWAYRGLRWHCLDVQKKIRHRPMRGFSALAPLPDGSCNPLGMQSLEHPDSRGSELHLETLSPENMEAARHALRDLRKWDARDSTRCAHVFWQVCWRHCTIAEVAQKLNEPAWRISRWMTRARFCWARRHCIPVDVLESEFGETEVARWTKSLEAALRGA